MAMSTDSDYAIANVQCHYDSEAEDAMRHDSMRHDSMRHDSMRRDGIQDGRTSTNDHTYNARDEPPAFLIHNVNNSSAECPKTLALPLPLPGGVNLIRVDELAAQPPAAAAQQPAPESFSKRVRRSEAVLRAAADCVSRGLTFQTASEQFNIPISTIRFFMARKGILPRRRRGRTTTTDRQESYRYSRSSSPAPPYHMQHYKLPDMLALHADDNS